MAMETLENNLLIELRRSEDAMIFNRAAKKVMKKHTVTINDIDEKSVSIHKAYGIGNDDVHYTEKGNEELAILIADFLEKEIRK